jgi:UDP-N-acetylmuramoyl-tripeptide--D-alanyl-D-alanine ligase
MPEFAFSDVLRWSGGKLAVASRAETGLILCGIGSDSRSIAPGSLFIALHGERHDGHRFLAQACLAGAGALLIDDAAAWSDLTAQAGAATLNADQRPPVILVPDTLQALQAIAAGYRQTLRGRVIGITGSVGKTSTRQMVSACLSAQLKTHQARANLNNEIGLPQTLLLAEADDQAIILEMGMRGPGEIRLLTRIANPDVAIITTIGTSHIGRLGSREAILAAKAEIVEGLRPGGLLILNADDPYLRRLGASLAGQCRVAWIAASGSPPADLPADLAPPDFLLLARDIETRQTRMSFMAMVHKPGQPAPAGQVRVELPFPGEHHVQNALFGLAAARELGVDLAQAAAGAETCVNTGNRQRILQAGPFTIMDDSYNASPESMLAALKTLAELAGPGRRKIALLGGMLELGDFAEEAHRLLGSQAASLGFRPILAVGPLAATTVAGARAAMPGQPAAAFQAYEDQTALIAALLPLLAAGDCLLVKGSRGFAMEKVTEAILHELARRGFYPPEAAPAGPAPERQV